MAADDLHTSPSKKAQADPSNRAVPPSPKPSQRWFWLAVVATGLGIIFIVGLFVGLAPTATDSSEESQEILAESASDALVVAVARTPGGPTEWSNWSKVIKELSEDLGVPVSVRYLAKEDEAADIIASEDIDIAFVCAHQYLVLRDAGAVIGLASPTIDEEHLTTFMLIAQADDPAENWEDLEGSAVAASDKSSLGGYAYLNALAAEHGATPETHFAEVRLGETQETNMRDLLDGEIRATVINSAQVAAWDTSGFKIIEESAPFATPPVVVDSEMDPELIPEITTFLLGFDAAILPPESHITGFVELDDADYAYAETLRDACGQHTHP